MPKPKIVWELGRLNTDTPLILFQTRCRSDALAAITMLLRLSVTQRLTPARTRRSFAFTTKQATWLKHTSTRTGRKIAPVSYRLVPARNAAAYADVISADASRVKVRIIRTDEELMIARSVCRIAGLSVRG